jgi:hypothetical protein
MIPNVTEWKSLKQLFNLSTLGKNVKTDNFFSSVEFFYNHKCANVSQGVNKYFTAMNYK